MIPNNREKNDPRSAVTKELKALLVQRGTGSREDLVARIESGKIGKNKPGPKAKSTSAIAKKAKKSAAKPAKPVKPSKLSKPSKPSKPSTKPSKPSKPAAKSAKPEKTEEKMSNEIALCVLLSNQHACRTRTTMRRRTKRWRTARIS